MESLMHDLTEPIGVSGHEEPIRKVLESLLPIYEYDVTVDAIGNMICILPGAEIETVITAHMDEIGLMVSGHTDKGMLEFVTLGGFDPRSLPNTMVLFPDGSHGVIGLPAPHLVKDKSKVIEIDDMVIDVGLTTKEGAQQAFRVGSVCVVDNKSFTMGDGIFVSRNTDNRAGCAVLLDLLKKRIPGVAFVFTAREEVGLQGAKGLQESFMPPDAEFINVDVTTAGELGKGCIVSLKDGGYIANQDMVEGFKAAGAKNFEVGKGGTSDHAALQFFRKACGISLPSAYIHSSVSKVSLYDIKDASKLIRRYLLK